MFVPNGEWTWVTHVHSPLGTDMALVCTGGPAQPYPSLFLTENGHGLPMSILHLEQTWLWYAQGAQPNHTHVCS